MAILTVTEKAALKSLMEENRKKAAITSNFVATDADKTVTREYTIDEVLATDGISISMIKTPTELEDMSQQTSFTLINQGRAENGTHWAKVTIPSFKGFQTIYPKGELSSDMKLSGTIIPAGMYCGRKDLGTWELGDTYGKAARRHFKFYGSVTKSKIETAIAIQVGIQSAIGATSPTLF